MTNTETLKANFVAREVRLLEEKHNNATDLKELAFEMKKAELTKVEIAAIHNVAKQNFETAEKREFRENVIQETANLRVALGPYHDSPLGMAAIERVGSRA